MAENILTNFQYSRQQQRYSSLTGITPTLPVLTGATMTGYTEADNMVLGNFTDTDLLDGELFLNTADNRVFIRSGNNILEFITSGSTLDNINTTGVTWDNSTNILLFTKSNGDTYQTTLDAFSGLTVNGLLSATTLDAGTILSGGTNLTDIFTPTLVDGNGTVINGNTVDLGGILNQNTTISGASQNLLLGDSNSKLNFFNVNAIQGIREYSVPGQSLIETLNPGGLNTTFINTPSNVETNFINDSTGVRGIAKSNGGVTYATVSVANAGNAELSHVVSGLTAFSGLKILSTGDYTFTDGTSKPKGLQYDADYSATYTPLSLITKGDLDAATSGSTGGYWSGSTGTYSLVPINQVGNVAYGLASLAGGAYAVTSGVTSFAYGNSVNANANYSVAFGAGNQVTAAGISSFVMGSSNIVSGPDSVTFGSANNISGNNASGFGAQITVSGNQAFAAGSSATASGLASAAFGGLTTASGAQSFAEGSSTIASGDFSHAQGSTSIAAGDYSHVGGYFSSSNGIGSFTHGLLNTNNSDWGAIIGGTGNTLTTGATKSIILGCNDITGTSANTVYACNIDATNYFSGGTNLLSILGGASTLDELSDVTTNLPLTPTEADDGKLLFYDYDIDQWTTDDAVTHGTVVINGKKASAGTIAKGTPVYLVGFDSDLHTVEAANASSSSTMPVIGLAAENLDDTNSKHITTFGKLTGVDTTTASTLNPNNEVWAVNDSLYMSTTTGGFTKVRPTGTAQIQRIVKVLKVDASGGQLFVFNTARTAGLPNLTTDNVWVGDANGIPQEVNDTTFVNNAGAVMNTDTTTAAMDFVIDEDSMASNLDTKVPTQQSVKAYVDNAVASAVSYDVCAVYDATGTPTYYSTLQAAITAASAGQTVQILTDITETGAVEITLKDGVNINGNGHTYTLSNATAGLNALKDNNVSVKCKILDLTVVRTTGTGYCLFLDNGSSEVDATGSFFKSTSYASVCCEGKLSNCEAYTTSGVYYAFYGTNGTSALGSFYNCKAFGSVNGFYRPKEAVDCVSRVSGKALETNSSTDRIINFYGYSTGDVAYYGGGCYVEGGFFVSDANHAFESVVTGGRINGGYYFSSANIAIEHYGSSKDIDINGATIRSTASQALVFSVNATGKVSNCHIESTAASTIYFDSGSTNLELYNCTVICLYNNIAGHTIQTNNTGVSGVIKGCILEVANTGANCITGLATTTLNYADNIYKGSPTTPINANIAQGITGTEDNYGNILI